MKEILAGLVSLDVDRPPGSIEKVIGTARSNESLIECQQEFSNRLLRYALIDSIRTLPAEEKEIIKDLVITPFCSVSEFAKKKRISKSQAYRRLAKSVNELKKILLNYPIVRAYLNCN